MKQISERAKPGYDALTADPEQEGALTLCAVCKESRVLVRHTFRPFFVVGQTSLEEREVGRLDLLGGHGVLPVKSAEVGEGDRLLRRCCVGIEGSASGLRSSAAADKVCRATQRPGRKNVHSRGSKQCK